MTKETKVIGWKVVVYPDDMVFWSGKPIPENEQKKTCRSVINLIKTHVSPHEGDIKDIDLEAITESKCSYCGAIWTEKSGEYNGGCCTEDEKQLPQVNQCSRQ